MCLIMLIGLQLGTFASNCFNNLTPTDCQVTSESQKIGIFGAKNRNKIGLF